MITGSVEIQRGDYAGGGKASAQIKKILNNLGVSSDIIRRAMVATFEAEMNIIIHSNGGKILYKVDEEKIEIEAVDIGPGIPNIVLAMKEGYSTAPPEARELGYGAGMGLPNIKRNTDFFFINSSDNGTLLKFIIKLNTNENFEEIISGVLVTSERCKKCLACVRECPTRAIRLRGENVVILSHRCINCNRCIEICPTKVFDLSFIHTQLSSIINSSENLTTLILPTPIVGKLYLEGKWFSCQKYLKSKWGIDVVSLYPWELSLRRTILEYARSSDTKYFPVISPVCPSVIQWIQTEYPSLIPAVAPYLFPFLSSIESYIDHSRVVYVPLCPSQCVAIRSLYKDSDKVQLLHPQFLYELIKDCSVEPVQIGNGDNVKMSKMFIDEYQKSIAGIISVRKFLDKLEREKIGKDLSIVELYNCYGGCFGFPFTDVEPNYLEWYVKKENFYMLHKNSEVRCMFRGSSLKMRKGIRLGSNMKESLQKLSLVEETYKSLPGRDCAVCGSPKCSDFAEEVAIYDVPFDRCPYLEMKRS